VRAANVGCQDLGGHGLGLSTVIIRADVANGVAYAWVSYEPPAERSRTFPTGPQQGRLNHRGSPRMQRPRSYRALSDTQIRVA
jgi:hypothetical protein